MVLSLRRLDRLEPVEPAAGQVTAGAGVTLGDAPTRRPTAPDGPTASTWPAGTAPPSGARVATNAGGLRVLRYGDTRAQVLGVEAVLGTGAVVVAPRRAW